MLALLRDASMAPGTGVPLVGLSASGNAGGLGGSLLGPDLDSLRFFLATADMAMVGD